MMREEKIKIVSDNEIDLLAIGILFWNRRWFIIKLTCIFIVLGIFVAITTPNEYSSTSTLIAESNSSDSKINGSLGGLASLAGLNLGSMSGSQGISPGLYQSISQSVPFLYEIMHSEYYFEELNKTTSLHDYYLNDRKVSAFSYLLSVPATIINWLKDDTAVSENIDLENDIMFLTINELYVAEDLKKRIFVLMDWDLNTISIEVKMQDPKVAAYVNKFTLLYITEFVKNYTVKKSRVQLEFVDQQLKERKNDFENAERKLAEFRDRNINISTSRAKTEVERLQFEYNLAFNVYNQLAQQRESVKLQLNDNIPVFSTLDPVTIPVIKSEPSRIMIVFVFLFIGLVVSILLILIRNIKAVFAS